MTEIPDELLRRRQAPRLTLPPRQQHPAADRRQYDPTCDYGACVSPAVADAVMLDTVGVDADVALCLPHLAALVVEWAAAPVVDQGDPVGWELRRITR